MEQETEENRAFILDAFIKAYFLLRNDFGFAQHGAVPSRNTIKVGLCKKFSEMQDLL